MGLFKRLKLTVSASINSMLDKVEDPVAVLNQHMRDLEEDVAEAKKALSAQMVVVRRLEKQVDEASRLVKQREGQAEMALKEGNDDLARQAIADRQHWEYQLQGYAKQHDDASHSLSELRKEYDQMMIEFEECRRRRSELLAQYESAQASKQIADTSASIRNNTGRARLGFDRMEDRISQIQTEAEVTRELNKPVDELNTHFKAQAVEEELAALRQKISTVS